MCKTKPYHRDAEDAEVRGEEQAQFKTSMITVRMVSEPVPEVLL